MIKWDDPISFVHGFTTQQRRALRSLEVETVGDLLSIFPRRYDDYTRIVPIARIPSGVPVTIKAQIKEIAQVSTFRRRFSLVRAVVSDESGSIGITWFNQPWLVKQLKSGDTIFISGSVTDRPRFGRGFTSPLWEPATEETLAAGTVAPVYPLTGSVAQKTLRKIMKTALDDVELPAEYLPQDIIERLDLLTLPEAYRVIHRPATLEKAELARRRFAFGELLIYQLALRLARIEADAAGAPVFQFDESFAKKFVSSLPFELTADQKKAMWAAVRDMEDGRPMRRLLQGDVGSGKTVVAAFLAALCYRNNASAVFMAPTDLLAKQHFETLRRFFVSYQISIVLVTSSCRLLVEGREEQRLTSEELAKRLQRGRVVAIGTHALLERGQSPPDLLLAIVDEQHRFGVAQRETLIVLTRQDGKVPHLLSMSATPIPRSLALTLCGDLEVSLIRTKPVGRLPVITRVVAGEQGRAWAYEQVKKEIRKRRRAFVVCPLIDPSDVLGVRSVEAETRRLQNGPLRGLRIGFLHGKMPVKDKDQRMQEFVNGELDVLVSTTVIEVGVDVPEATIMIIEGAERFGLAQLHQLRGRVGRSSDQSFCVLIATDELSNIERLRILERTTDGFIVAEEDLRLRGEGNLLGTQQSGQAVFQCARMDDLELMARAREISSELVEKDPTLVYYPLLRERVLQARETSHRE